MQFKPYKKDDGTEELRLVPESKNECDNTECEKCFFKRDHNPEVEDSEINAFLDSLTEDQVNRLYSKTFGENRPGFLGPADKATVTEMMEMLGVPIQNIGEAFKDGQHVKVRTFAIKDGKVITDPETRKIMEHMGLIDKIEGSFRDND